MTDGMSTIERLKEDSDDEELEDGLTEAELTSARTTWDADVDERLENWKDEHPISSRRQLIDALRADGASDYGFGRIWILASLAVLFNPFQPIVFTRETWSVIDLGAAFSFALLASDLRANRKQVIEQLRNETNRLNADVVHYEARQQSPNG